jgi:excisionase family DNA binding protein
MSGRSAALETPSPKDSMLLTVEEVAALLRLKPSSIYDAAARGRLPAVRLWTGRRRSVVRFRRADIERFIAERVQRVRPRRTR